MVAIFENFIDQTHPLDTSHFKNTLGTVLRIALRRNIIPRRGMTKSVFETSSSIYQNSFSIFGTSHRGKSALFPCLATLSPYRYKHSRELTFIHGTCPAVLCRCPRGGVLIEKAPPPTHQISTSYLKNTFPPKSTFACQPFNPFFNVLKKTNVEDAVILRNGLCVFELFLIVQIYYSTVIILCHT